MKKLWVAALALLLTGCASSDKVGSLQPSGYLRDAPQIIADADWDNAETQTMTIFGRGFHPDELTFHRYKPTRLVVVNQNDSEHIIATEGFFQTIAVRQVTGTTGTVSGPYIEQLVVPPGQTKELWFVPARYGAWRFYCDEAGHSLLGEKGLINVVQ